MCVRVCVCVCVCTCADARACVSVSLSAASHISKTVVGQLSYFKHRSVSLKVIEILDKTVIGFNTFLSVSFTDLYILNGQYRKDCVCFGSAASGQIQA